MLIEDVKQVIAQALHIPPEKLSENSQIGDFPEWNSLGHMLIISAIEEHFGIALDSAIIMDLESVEDFSSKVFEALQENRKNNELDR